MTDIINEIEKTKNGIVVINGNKIAYYNRQETLNGNLGNIGFEEFILKVSCVTDETKMRSHVLEENSSAILIIGNLNRTEEECNTLAQMFEMVSLKEDTELISSIIGIPYLVVTPQVTKKTENKEKVTTLISKKNPQNYKKRLMSFIGVSVASAMIASLVLFTVILPGSIENPDGHFPTPVAFASVFKIDTSLNNQGDELFKNKKYREAENWYTEALKSDPENYIILTNKGTTFAEREMYDDALVWYDQALDINSNYVNALINKGLTFSNLEKNDDALVWYYKALEIDSDNIRALNAYAYSLALDTQYEKSIEYYEKSLKLDPTDVDVLISKGNVLAELEMYDDAIESYSKALNINPNHLDALYYKGLALYNLDKYSESVILLDRALEIDPDDVKIINLKQKILEDS